MTAAAARAVRKHADALGAAVIAEAQFVQPQPRWITILRHGRTTFLRGMRHGGARQPS